jgi:hypothetical protein
MKQDVSGFPDHEGVVAQVEFAPGANEPRHTHAGDIFGYVTFETAENSLCEGISVSVGLPQ